MITTRSSRSSRRAGQWPPRRRGAAVVMFAVFLMFIMMFVAIAADFGRAYVARNELQTAADASAMAGALHLMRHKDATQVAETTKVYAGHNYLFDQAVSAAGVTVEIGKWDDINQQFITGVGIDEADAVRSTVKQYVDFHFAPLLGINGRDVTVKAIGWAGADVSSSTDCLKPWTMPLKYLKKAILGADYATDPNPDTLTHSDIAKLDSLAAVEAPELNFTMKQGTGAPDDNAGNFYSVAMPPACTVSDQKCDGKPQLGNEVVENVRTCSNAKLEIGDVLETMPGVQAQPTIDAISDFCEAQSGDRTCANQEVKASFFTELSDATKTWTSAVGYNTADKSAGGTFPVEIAVMGSFKITGVTKTVEKVCTTDPATGKSTCTNQPKAVISGRFIRKDDPGPVGPAPSMLRRTILVR